MVKMYNEYFEESMRFCFWSPMVSKAYRLKVLCLNSQKPQMSQSAIAYDSRCGTKHWDSQAVIVRSNAVIFAALQNS